MSHLHLFQGFGVELEYMVVDVQDLSVLPVVDRILDVQAGSIVSEVEVGPLAWSNELVLHVVELKTNGPAATLKGLAALFQEHVRQVNRIAGRLGGMLLPSAMHPWMDPLTETVLWPHEHSPVYESYDRIFGCQGHGWSNLQSVHLNLPFADDGEFGRLHAGIRLLLPLLPALAASSPLVESKATGLLDNRMEFYRHNSRRVPFLTGEVIPEPVFGVEEYKREILDRMYRDIAPFDPEGILQDEFLNSRGAIPRFGRGSMEIRVVDVQECPAADLAVIGLTAGALQLLAQEELSPLEVQQDIESGPLVSVFLDGIRRGDKAIVEDKGYLKALGLGPAKLSAGEVWWHLFEQVERFGTLLGEEDRTRVSRLLRRGPLARQILRALEVPADKKLDPAPVLPRSWLEEVYSALAKCLEEGEFFVV